MRMTKLTGIDDRVRDAVLKRDSWEDTPCCVCCGSPHNIELHHYVERSRGGLGREQNLICLCHKCHTKLHEGDEQVKEYCKAYLKDCYKGWSESKQIARKGENNG